MSVVIYMPINAMPNDEIMLLSELSESECLEFVKDRGVMLPDLREKESDWGPFVKRIITLVEANPNVDFGISYTVSAGLAEEIRDVVNAYYGVNEWEQRSQLFTNARTDSATWLEDSEVHGEWDESFRLYNCYSFVLGYTVAYNPGAVAYIQTHPDDIAALGYDFNLYEYTAEQIGEIVCEDLEIRGKERIIMEPSEMDTSNLCNEEEIICLRIGTDDYHFMKFTSEGWLHKPARTQVLRYKYTPADSRYWTNERVVDGVFLPSTLTYDSTIYFISYNGHDWGYTYSGNGIHTKSCSICGDAFTSNCQYSYTYTGNNNHSVTCVDCGNTAYGVSCIMTTTCNNDGTHTRSCNSCSNEYTDSCNLEYTNLTNTRHSVSCTVCDYEVNSQLCTLTYTSNGNQTHTVCCTLCGNSRVNNCSLVTNSADDNQHFTGCNKCDYGYYSDCVAVYVYCGSDTLGDVHKRVCQTCNNPMGSGTESCTLVYQYNGQVNGSNTHVHACTDCGHVDSGPTACTYIGTKPCLLCGSVKDQVSINESEEDAAQG